MWVAERRGEDALTRRIVLWHESAPEVIFKTLVSIQLVVADTQDEWTPDLVSVIAPPSEWLVKSALPMQGPDLRLVPLRWVGNPVHFGYAIPRDALRFT